MSDWAYRCLACEERVSASEWNEHLTRFHYKLWLKTKEPSQLVADWVEGDRVWCRYHDFYYTTRDCPLCIREGKISK